LGNRKEEKERNKEGKKKNEAIVSQWVVGRGRLPRYQIRKAASTGDKQVERKEKKGKKGRRFGVNTKCSRSKEPSSSCIGARMIFDHLCDAGLMKGKKKKKKKREEKEGREQVDDV